MNLWPSVGLKSPAPHYLLNLIKGWGLLAKYVNSNTASGRGKLNFCNWEYSPVPGDLKSGIPAATLKPAPVRKTTFLYFLFLSSSIICS